ncbi:hypothetical protein C482_05731 [Natrialba chahannaoensis JCM 10990]|uniref:GATA-type domain-containing protein n=1 Tax=Natrialba chahannaoensis JCM 10990 TaxID=1227492 RepID=M0AXE6_9EURY|nr:hypothetical protein [Natrialba chahannaoensis]ELZ02074.1 hypothetical protein C482_05731 [Natrialba chahannaoensis JCM 10990]
MTDDATLSSFGTDADDDAASESAAENGSAFDSESAPTSTADSQTETDTGDEKSATDATTIELTTSLATYAVQPPDSEFPHTCTECDAESRRLWRDDGQFVCPACKVW